MLIEKNSTNALASEAPLPASVAAPAILPTSSHYHTPAVLSRRSSRSVSARVASIRSSAQEVTLPTTRPPRSWSRSRARSPRNPSRSRSSMFRYAQKRPSGLPHVASSSAAIGKHLHSVFVSRSSAHKGGSDASSVLDTDIPLIVFIQLGLPSMMVSTTAIDCRTSYRDAGTMPRHKCWLATSRRHICAKVPCSPHRALPFPFPIHAVPICVHQIPYM
jgi:hypothetical protein